MRRKRYGPTGGHYNSRKYHAMHKKNISESLKAYHYGRNALQAYENGTATPEQIAYVERGHKLLIGVVVLLLFLCFVGLWLVS